MSPMKCNMELSSKYFSIVVYSTNANKQLAQQTVINRLICLSISYGNKLLSKNNKLIDVAIRRYIVFVETFSLLGNHFRLSFDISCLIFSLASIEFSILS